MSVLPDTGSELPADSDRAAVVCAAPLDEAVENAWEVVGLHVGQLWFRTDSEDVLPLMSDEHSMINDLVQPESVPVVQTYMDMAKSKVMLRICYICATSLHVIHVYSIISQLYKAISHSKC